MVFGQQAKLEQVMNSFAGNGRFNGVVLVAKGKCATL